MFTVVKLPEDSGRIFMIVRKDALIEGGLWKKLPIEVYGFLKVVGRTYYESHVSYANMADKVLTSKELFELEERAKLEVFPVD